MPNRVIASRLLSSNFLITELCQMKKFLLFVIFIGFSQLAAAADIASCHSPQGQSFYPLKGLTPEKDTGWMKDSISGGQMTLTTDGKNFDMLYVDARKKITSTVSDGGKVLPFRIYKDDIAIIIAYEDLIEIYNFWKTTDGKLQFSMLQNRGSGAAIPKSSLLIGNCDFINFDAFTAKQ
jgi:hypothetical protein